MAPHPRAGHLIQTSVTFLQRTPFGPLEQFAVEINLVGYNNVAMSLRPGKKITFLILLFLTGCYKQPGAGQVPPNEVLTFAKQQLEAIRTRNFPAVESNLGPQLKSVAARETLNRVADLFPAGEPKSVKLLAFVENKKNCTTDMAFEYGYSQKWLLARVSVVKTNNSMFVRGFFVNPANMPIQDMLAMHWGKHGAIHYVFLGAAIIDPIFILATLVLCIRTSIPKRKWLWLLFIAFGWIQLTLNWHTGEWKVNPLGFQFLGSGYFAPMIYPPIIWPLFITTSVPIGAIIFIFKRKKYLASNSIPDQIATLDKDESN